jgi:hypothetical protein
VAIVTAADVDEVESSLDLRALRNGLLCRDPDGNCNSETRNA